MTKTPPIYGPIEAPFKKARRYSSHPFPPYRFVPGITPHPKESPQEHSFGYSDQNLAYSQDVPWFFNERYLYGVDLYNYAFWWESHEAIEVLWQKEKKGNLSKLFFQGLIKIAAALLKRHMGQRRGMNILFSQGRENLASVLSFEDVFMGIPIRKYLTSLEKFFSTKESGLSAEYPFLILDFPAPLPCRRKP